MKYPNDQTTIDKYIKEHQNEDQLYYLGIKKLIKYVSELPNLKKCDLEFQFNLKHELTILITFNFKYGHDPGTLELNNGLTCILGQCYSKYGLKNLCTFYQDSSIHLTVKKDDLFKTS